MVYLLSLKNIEAELKQNNLMEKMILKKP